MLGSLPVERAVTEALIYVIIVVGLYVFIGNSGIISLGHVAFIGVAAYATAWQTCCADAQADHHVGPARLFTGGDLLRGVIGRRPRWASQAR
ncbi:MAG: hypothetical protein U5L11_16590 [Arhodomonas sp.]|nr:hypothetical protein [Arhodomonas sp.]